MLLIHKHVLKEYFKRSSRCFAFFLLSLFALPLSVFAATLSLEPASGEYGPGDMFIVTVRLDTPINECVNAASVELFYPKDWVRPTAISKGESLFSLWVEEPNINEERGLITFSGGIPAGYCGRVQGDPGKTNILLRIVFTLPGNMIGGKVTSVPEPLVFSFGEGSRVLANDGMGTNMPLQLESTTLTRLLVSPGIRNEWVDIVRADDIPPDEFTVTIERDPNILEGKYFLAFTTVDKQSGIEHFAVREDDPERLGFVRGAPKPAEFVRSPSLYYYELSDQELKSRITVRAVDKARNYTDKVLPPTRGDYSRMTMNEQVSRAESLPWMITGGVFLFTLLCVGAFLFIRSRRRVAKPVASPSSREPVNDDHAE